MFMHSTSKSVNENHTDTAFTIDKNHTITSEEEIIRNGVKSIENEVF